MTPYLYDSIEKLNRIFSQEGVAEQKQKYGFDENNLAGVKQVETKKYEVILRPKVDLFRMPSDLVISGCTEYLEREVRKMKGSGILFARYSIFYGSPSEYTDRRPEDSGYAFDIPKSVETVKKLITCDALLEGILAREEKKIVKAVEGLNKGLASPVLITPYLRTALQYAK